MHVDLIAAREAAMGRFDRAIGEHGSRYDSEFAAALEPVIRELVRIVDAAAAGKSDSIELSRTLRWLGDVYFDHGRFAGRPSWLAGSEAYERAERLLVGNVAPVEQAKLDFNFANTLGQLSGGTDVGLLESADIRYGRASRAFRDANLMDFARRVEQAHALLRPRLEASRQLAGMDRDHQRLQELAKQAATADRIAQAKIRQELAALTQRFDPKSILATLEQSLSAISATGPPTAADQERVRALGAELAALASALATKPATADQAKPAPEFGEMAELLQNYIRASGESGAISPDKADELSQSLKKFMASTPLDSDDVLTHEAKLVRMGNAKRVAADAVVSRQRPGPPPRPESRLARAFAIVDALQRAIIAEMQKPMLPADETRTANDLFADVARLSARIEQAGDDDTRIAALEPQLWRMALDVQQFARRYHLTIAKPDFAMLHDHAPLKSMFISGAQILHKAATRLADRDDVKLFWEARRGEVAQERWSQLLAASIAVFDIGLPAGAARMQVCYEFGLALAMGKPCIVVIRNDTIVPFDIEIRPVVFSDDDEANFRSLDAAVQAVLSEVIWGGRTPQLGDAGNVAISAMERHLGVMGPGQLDVHFRMARANVDDAIALRGSLENITGSLGARGAAIFLPAWPPAAPAPAARPECFHIMPFSQTWSRGTRDLVADICAREGWSYTRGDESTTQRIIPGIWQEICRASAVVIDVTGFNVNVGLELGLVHALGRPYRIVSRDRTKDCLFPALAKVQVHRYQAEPVPQNMRGQWINWFYPRPRSPAAVNPSLESIVRPLLLQASSQTRST